MRDTVLVTFVSCCVSVVAGFVVFSFLGFLSHETDTAFRRIDLQSDFPFVMFPEAVRHVTSAPFWSIIFFLMLLAFGIGTQIGLVETIATGFMDRFRKRFTRHHKTFIYFCTCAVLGLFGLIFCTRGGVFTVVWLEFYGGHWSVFLIGLFQCIAVGWVYGWRSMSNDLQTMLGLTTSMWWLLCWNIVTPAVLGYMVLFSWAVYTEPSYGSYEWPRYSHGAGVALTVVIVLPVPVTILLHLLLTQGSFFQRWHTISTPTKDWGPYLFEHRGLITYQKGFNSGEVSARSQNSMATKSSVYAIHSTKRSMGHNHSEDNAGFNNFDSKLSRNT